MSSNICATSLVLSNIQQIIRFPALWDPRIPSKVILITSEDTVSNIQSPYSVKQRLFQNFQLHYHYTFPGAGVLTTYSLFALQDSFNRNEFLFYLLSPLSKLHALLIHWYHFLINELHFIDTSCCLTVYSIPSVSTILKVSHIPINSTFLCKS